MKPLKLRTKLTLSYAAIITLLLSGISALFYNLLGMQLEQALREELEERAGAIRGFILWEGEQPRFVFDSTDSEEAFFVKQATRYYQIYDAGTGMLVDHSQDMEALGFQYTPKEVKDLLGGPVLTGIQTEQANLLLHNDQVRAPSGKAYLLQVGASLEPRETALGQLRRIILWLLPAGILLAMLTGWWMARQLLRPVTQLSQAAKEISISQLDRRLPVCGSGDELDDLAGTFNEVFTQLNKTVIQLKDFTANLSHELRTPLTVLRGEAEVALAKAHSEEDYRRVLESQLEELEKLSLMVQHMLILARAEAGQIQLAREPVNLAKLAESLIEQMEAVASNRDIGLHYQCLGEATVTGDPGWLERMILNLLDNAIKFTDPGGRIDVKSHQQGTEVVLEIKDSGIGIPAQVLPHVFERFYRGDPSRSKAPEGAGLGLSLVKWIVKEHHGHIRWKADTGKEAWFPSICP